VGALGVVVFDVSGDRRAGGGEVVKAVLPGAFLFEGADEPLAKAVLLGRVGSDVLPRCARPEGSLRLAISASLRFLRETVVAHEGAVGTRAEDKAVIVAQGES
jgi:hypothetical protein